MATYNYNVTNGTEAQVVKELCVGVNDSSQQTVSIVKDNATRIEQAHAKVLELQEEGSKAKMTTFSNEQGKQLNAMYNEYFDGSIKENFDMKVDLMEQKIALMQEIAEMRLTIKQEKLNADMEIQEKLATAQLKLDTIKKQINQCKAQKVWNIVCPILGVALGVMTFCLLNIMC